MLWLRWPAALVLMAMTALFGNILAKSSLDEGIGMDRFLAGLADPWSTFIGFDLMAGLLLMACWIVWRELGSRALESVAWVLCVLWWGNVVCALYILVALAQSGGEPERFFMGRRGGSLRAVWPGASAPLRLLAFASAIALAAHASLKITHLGIGSLAGLAYLPAFAPLVLALLLLAFPSRADRSQAENDSRNRPSGP